MGYTKQKILNIAETEDVEFIRLQFTDLFGTLKNVAITELDEVGKYLNILNKKNPSDYSIRLIASSIDYTKMRMHKFKAWLINVNLMK